MIAFGPIPSRRLGKSLGINNIPFKKLCSYSCIYCQVGPTEYITNTRQRQYDPSIIFREVQKHLQKLDDKSQPDYLTFVANGEPTLDINLGQSIEKLKIFNIPIAVITNGSLLNDLSVREDLKSADFVSVKIDTADVKIWKTLSRPYSDICFDNYIEGLLKFSQEYKNKLVSETMLIQDIDDNYEIIKHTVELITQVNPSVSYISIPTRPPTISWVKAPYEDIINKAYQMFLENNLNAELLLGFEGTDAGYTGNAKEDIINICTVHPIREDTMQQLLEKNNADHSIVESLIKEQYIQKVNYKSKTFYVRKYHAKTHAK